MKILNKNALCLIVFFTALLAVAGCEYVPLKVYEIETKDGQILNLSCPTIDRNRNTFTYFVDRHCSLIK